MNPTSHKLGLHELQRKTIYRFCHQLQLGDKKNKRLTTSLTHQLGESRYLHLVFVVDREIG